MKSLKAARLRQFRFLKKWAIIGMEWSLGAARGGPNEAELEKLLEKIRKEKFI
jgi:hypothetical protein